MNNSGLRGKRTKDTKGIVSVAEQFNQQQFLIPTVSSFSITDESYVPLDDEAVDSAGGQTIVVNGSGFAPGVTVTVGGETISVVTYIDSGRLAFTAPAKISGSYTIFVTNANGGTGILVPGLVYSGVPTFYTAAGSLGSIYETTSISKIVEAAGDEPITYSISSGTLPAGATLNSDGTITGTAPVDSGSTTYSFTVKATDDQNQDSLRSFSLTIDTDVVAWSTPTNNQAFTLSGGSAISPVTLSATSAAGYGVQYAANTLPTGLALSGDSITGTPTVAQTIYTQLTATANTTGRSATRIISWTIALGDSNWKNVALLLNGSTPASTFIHDASDNNSQLTILGDTRPSNFNPYQGDGFYSVSHSATPDYLSVPHNSNFSLTSGQTDTFIIEGWFYFNAVTAQTVLFDKSGVNSVSFANWAVYLNASKQIQLQWGVSGTPGTSNIGTVPSTFIPVTGTWYHIAFVKSSADWAVFANGTRIISYNGLNTAGDANPSALKIGFGIQGAANSAYFNGHISNVRAWRGTSGAPYSATSTTLTVPTGPLTAIAGTTLLSHQSARFVDVSSAAATLTVTGANLKVSQAIPFASNTSASTYGSAYFYTAGNYLQITNSSAIQLGSENFTVEGWYCTTATRNSSILTLSGSGTVNYMAAIYLYQSATDTIRLQVSENGTSSLTVIESATINLNTWYHFAVVRNGQTITFYLNGISVGSVNTTTAGTSLSTGTYHYIGTGKTTTGTARDCYGYISDVRIIKGTAVVPPVGGPTTPLTAVANTQLLTCQYNGGVNNNVFLDQSGFNNIITRTGNVSQGTFSPYIQTGWSNYYPALAHSTYAANPISSFGAGATFTVEGWVNMSVYPATNYHFSLLASCDQGTATYWAIGIGSTGLATVYWYDGNAKQCVGSTTLTKGNWYHVAVVVTAGVVKIYVNGNQETLSGTTTLTNPTGNSSYTTGTERGSSNGGSAGYISNLRMSTSAVYPSAFTPSTIPLTPAITSNVSATLMTAQDNRFIDNSLSERVITLGTTKPTIQAYSPFGGVTSVPTGYSYKLNTGNSEGCVYFPDNNALRIGTNQFTMECWVNLTQWVNGSAIIATKRAYNSTGTGSWIFYIGTNGAVALDQLQTPASIITTAAGAVTTGSWYHIALTRDIDNVVRIYINGVNSGTTSPTSTFNFSSTDVLYVGKNNDSGNYKFIGRMSNFRLVNGTALYTGASNITVPTSTLTSVTNTALLTYHTNTVEDGSPNKFVPVVLGPGVLTATTFNPFGTTTTTTKVVYTPSVNGGSIYFDGTGDYLSAVNSKSFDLNVGPWTIECWFYQQAAKTVQLFSVGASAWRLAIGSSQGGEFTFNGSSTMLIPNGTFALNQWNHFAVTFNADGTSTAVKTFANGKWIGSGQFWPSADTTSVFYVGRNTDAGSGWDFNGYISDITITKGRSKYNASFVPSFTPLSVGGDTAFLLNGTSGGIIDAHGINILETAGNTQLTSSSPYSGASAGKSLYFDGTGDYLSTGQIGSPNLDLVTGDFTIEGWVYNAGPGAERYILSQRGSSSGWELRINSDNRLQFFFTGGSSQTTTGTVPSNQWAHIAVTRSANSLKLYINGTLDSTNASFTNGTSAASSYPVYIGNSTSAGGGLFLGYMKDLRITKGVARTITVPTSPYESQ